MLEAEIATTELKRLLKENERQRRLAEQTTRPDDFRIRTLANAQSRLQTKLTLIQRLKKDVKELESITSLKMMTRYPENQPYRLEYKRELNRLRRQLKDIAMRYQPKEKPKSRFAA